MSNLFKKNPSLIIGLALPLLMMTIFAGIPFISSYFVAAPKYDFIYSLYDNGLKKTFKVEDGKLLVHLYNPRGEPVQTDQEFYCVNSISQTSTKLNLAASHPEDFIIPPFKSREFVIKDISLKHFKTAKQSPDGYQIEFDDDGPLFFEFVLGGHKRKFLTLRKSGRVYRFPVDSWQVQFEGWLIP